MTATDSPPAPAADDATLRLEPTSSRRSHLDIVDPDERAAEKAPPDVVWVDWDGPDDPANPLNWSRRRKWVISSVGSFFCTLVSLSVSGYSIAEVSVEEELDTSKTLSLLGLTTFTLAFAIAPLILAPLSEVYGRSFIYFASAVVFALFFIPQALAKNIETVLIARFISGCAGSTAVSIAGGTFADVWRGADRGAPMAFFTLAAVAGPGLGPVMFGYLAQIKGFPYLSWVLFAMSSVFALSLPFILDETRASVLLSRKAARLRKETGDERYQSKDDFERGSIRELMKTSLGRPVQMLMREPVLIAITAWISFTWVRLLHLFLVSIPTVYKGVFGFNTGQAGLVYMGQFVGGSLGMIFDRYCERFYQRNVAKRGPEARLYSAFGGGIFLPVGAFIFCFTSYPQCHWMGSVVGVVILYAGVYLSYLAAYSYLAEAYTLYAASALSAMSFARNVIAAVFPLFTPAMYDRLGVQGATGLTAGLDTLLSVTPFVLFAFGGRLRLRSPFAMELARREEADRVKWAALKGDGTLEDSRDRSEEKLGKETTETAV
uniref:BY PROTMAP: gi/472587111/gb/EMS24610.1/ MFS polyamine transporter [Rhodosporidium toruloides NP11] gi/647394703/emb/CDR35936.1/ RHTO0S01e10528g1_1 [Rhodosporidium toruloides] n=1 Tax=Rhodotorula toruloides TaxID=5286 RepID=A0A0K3CDZ5_RHOTO